jgi:hypothetical protein
MGSRCLIAISSCWDFEKNGFNAACRETWIPLATDFDVRFFVGKGQGAETAELPSDTILLNVDDGYGTLSYKTQACFRWAHARDYPYAFHAFPDTYIVPERLISCGFETLDYLGDFRDEMAAQGNYASGGPGYWLSRKAFSLLLNAPVLGVWDDSITIWAEDLWVGRILARHPDLLYRDDWARFVNHGSRYFPTRANGVITSHLSCPDPYTDPARMYAAHNSWLNS